MMTEIMTQLLTEYFPTILPPTLVLTYGSLNIYNLAKRNYHLKQFSQYNGRLIAEKPNIKNSEVVKTEIKGILKPYIEKLVQEYPEDVKYAYNNIGTVVLKKRRPGLFCDGRYYNKENLIEYEKNDVLGHEFLHMASCIIDDEQNVYFSGFRQSKEGASIGTGLNEGYTELLASRLYNKNNKVRGYKNEVKVARMLEVFFDNYKEMSHLYFGANLPGLVKHLETYDSRENIIKLIKDIDIMNGLRSNPLGVIKRIQIQIKLYKYFISKDKSPEKLNQMNQLVNEDKLLKLCLNKQKWTLYRDNPYDKKTDQNLEDEYGKTI